MPNHLSANYKHGMNDTPEWNAWRAMRARCYNPRSHNYRLYGARGITVCQEWRESFSAFFIDMGMRPSEEHSLDRIDVNGNYCKENCKWSTAIEQSRNRRRSVHITINNTTKTVKEWAEFTNQSASHLSKRLKRMPHELAVFGGPLTKQWETIKSHDTIRNS